MSMKNRDECHGVFGVLGPAAADRTEEGVFCGRAAVDWASATGALGSEDEGTATATATGPTTGGVGSGRDEGVDTGVEEAEKTMGRALAGRWRGERLQRER